MVLIYNKLVTKGSQVEETKSLKTFSELPESIKAGSFVAINKAPEPKSYGSTVAPNPPKKPTERVSSYYQDMKTVQKNS